MAQIHRFRDCVALSIGNGATVYLTPADARKIAKGLNAGARDIGAHGFGSSQFGSVDLGDIDAPETGTGIAATYRHKRD